MTFNHPPINLIDSVMIAELSELFRDVERNNGPAVIIFDSADPDYFLAHYDISNDNRSRISSLARGPTGFHPWLDVLIRLSKLPAVTISAIRGRARGAGSEFTLATDIRFASRQRAVLGQFEIGIGATPGDGPASHLARLVGRGRAMEILVGGEDFDCDLAERYGYVNRAIPDDEFNDFIDRFARRVAAFDRQGLMDIKQFVNKFSLPDDEESPQMDALRQAVTRPAPRGRTSKLFELGLQQRSEVELNLGEYIERIAETDVPPGHLTSVSWSRSVVRPGLLTEAPEAALTSGNVLFVGVVSRCWAVFDGPATAQTARAPSACLRPNLPERLNKVIGDLCHSFWPIRMP